MLTGFAVTGTSISAGSAAYLPNFPANGGVVGRLMTYAGGGFICSGTLLPDRQSILSAAHCGSDGFGTPGPLTTTVLFQPPTGLSPSLTATRRPPRAP
jgi:hypothetical protein